MPLAGCEDPDLYVARVGLGRRIRLCRQPDRAVADREVVGRAVDRDRPEHVQVARIDPHHGVVDCVRHPDGPCPDGDACSAAAGRDVSRDPATRGVDAEEPVGELARDPDAAGADCHVPRGVRQANRLCEPAGACVDPPEARLVRIADHPGGVPAHGQSGEEHVGPLVGRLGKRGVAGEPRAGDEAPHPSVRGCDPQPDGPTATRAEARKLSPVNRLRIVSGCPFSLCSRAMFASCGPFDTNVSTDLGEDREVGGLPVRLNLQRSGLAGGIDPPDGSVVVVGDPDAALVESDRGGAVADADGALDAVRRRIDPDEPARGGRSACAAACEEVGEQRGGEQGEAGGRERIGPAGALRARARARCGRPRRARRRSGSAQPGPLASALAMTSSRPGGAGGASSRCA